MSEKPVFSASEQPGSASAPVARPIEWGAVQALAMVVGVREAARRMQLSEEQVKKRCTREGWLKSPEARAAQQLAVADRSGKSAAVPMSPLSPANMILAEIATLGAQSRLSLAKGVQKASAHVEKLDGGEILDRSADVKAIAQTADLVHGWKDQTPNVKIRLDVLNAPSEQPVYDVDSTVEMDVTFSDSESTEVDDY